MKSVSTSGAISATAVVLATIAVVAVGPAPLSAQQQRNQTRTVRARVQAHPGGPVEDVEMRVRDVPVDPESVSADSRQRFSDAGCRPPLEEMLVRASDSAYAREAEP